MERRIKSNMNFGNIKAYGRVPGIPSMGKKQTEENKSSKFVLFQGATAIGKTSK